MKRIGFPTILLSLLLCTGVAHAEGYWGFHGGVNVADMDGDIALYGESLARDIEDAVGGVWTSSDKGRTAFAGGLSYARMDKPSIGFQFEANYVSRGVRFEFATGGVQAKADHKLNYFEFPLMLRWAPTHGHSKQIILMLGPTLGFLSSPEVSVSGVNVPDLQKDIEGATGTIFGVSSAVVFRYTLGENSALTLQGRFYKGVTNAIEHTDYESRSQDFALLAGMEFAFGE